MEVKILEQRQKPRIEAKIKIASRKKDLSYETFMGNISQSGIFLETPKPFAKIGEKIDMLIHLPASSDSIGVLGKVVRIVGPNQVGKQKGVGIEFLKIEARQTALFNRFLEEILLARGIGCRKFPRVDARIVVAFKSKTDMGKCLSGNLSKGGIFLQTKANITLGQIVSLSLIHPVTEQALELDGEIVHVRKSIKQNSKVDFSDGIGIKFVDLDSVKQERLKQFLRNLLIQKKKRKSRKKAT